MELTQEQIAQAYACKTPDELIALAKANGVELTEEEAQAFFDEFAEEHYSSDERPEGESADELAEGEPEAELTEGELADEELDNVAGGAGCPKRHEYDVEYFARKEDVQFIFNVDDVVQAFVGTAAGGRTATVKIEKRDILSTENFTYYDVYKVSKTSGHGIFGWEKRDRFQVR